jgi:hypothetical protein
MDRIKMLELKKQKGTITDEECDELFDLKQEEYELGMSEYEKVGLCLTPYGIM